MAFNEVKLPDGTVLNLSEWLHWPLYSTIEFAAADAINLDAFSYNPGKPVPSTPGIARRTSTRRDTNLDRSRTMNQDEAIVIFAITYENFGLTTVEDGASPPNPVAPAPLMDATDLRRMQRDLYVALKVGAGIKKPQVEAPFSWFGQSIAPVVGVSGDLASIHLGTAGEPTPQNQATLNLPVYIGGFGQNAVPGNSMVFVLNVWSVNGPIGGMQQNISQRWWLDGLRRRPG